MLRTRLRPAWGIAVIVLATLVSLVPESSATVMQVGGPAIYPGGVVALPGGTYRDANPVPFSDSTPGNTGFPWSDPVPGIYGVEVRRGNDNAGSNTNWELAVGPYTNYIANDVPNDFAFFSTGQNDWDSQSDRFTITWTPSLVRLELERIEAGHPGSVYATYTVSWGLADFAQPGFAANDSGLPFEGDSAWDVGNAVRVSARSLSTITLTTLDGTVLNQTLAGAGAFSKDLTTLYFAGAELLDGWVMTGTLNVDVANTSDSWGRELLVTVGTYDAASSPAVEPVPEPGTVGLVATGLLGLGIAARRGRWYLRR